MHKTSLIALLSIGLAGSMAAAQTPGSGAAAPSVLRLTVDTAVAMALERNVDLRASRLDPQISDTRVAAAAGIFRPTFNSSLQQNNQLQPPTSFLIPVATSTDAVTS